MKGRAVIPRVNMSGGQGRAAFLKARNKCKSRSISVQTAKRQTLFFSGWVLLEKDTSTFRYKSREVLRYLAGSLGQGMARKVLGLRAALLVSGAVRLVHPRTERIPLSRAMLSRKRRNPRKKKFLTRNRFHLFILVFVFFYFLTIQIK